MNLLEEGKEPAKKNCRVNIVGSAATVSLLKNKRIKTAVCSDAIILEPISSSQSAQIGHANKIEQVNGLTAISRFANQSIDKDHNPVTYSRVASAQSYMPIISKVDTLNLPKNQLSIQMRHGELLQQKSVENNTKANVLMAAPTTPSVADSTTANHHANRSLVYGKSVSSKYTAPIKISNEIKIINLPWTDSGSARNFINSTTDSCEANAVALKQTVGLISIEPIRAPLVEAQTKNPNEPVSNTTFILSRSDKQLLEEQYNLLNTKSGNNKYPHVKQVLQEYTEWAKVNKSPNDTFLPVVRTKKMDEIFAKRQLQKRGRAKSTYICDTTVNEIGGDTMEIINLDELPEKMDKSEARVYRTTTTHDSLYNMLRSDAQKVLESKKVQEPKLVGSQSIQISNGQLSDINGPIRLLDKSTKQIPTSGVTQVARIQSQNAAIASLPHKDKARKLKESIKSNEIALSLMERSGDEKQKRTYSRSKSLSNQGCNLLKLEPKSRMHFKIGNLNSQVKLKKIGRKPIKTINHDQDWQQFGKVLTNMSKPPSNDQLNNGNDSRARSPSEIEQFLSWNTNKTLGQLPTTDVIFQRNEFGLTEMDRLAMTKMKAMKMHKNDYKNFPQIEPSMACGHPDSAACFDDIVQRLNCGNPNINCKVYEKKPHQYYSTEFKQIVGALVQNKNNNCQAITVDDIKEALRETNMYDRTKNSSHFSWSRYIDYYNKKVSSDKRIQLAPADLFVTTFPKSPNTFEIGQKLESIDPQNSSLFCVCTIVDRMGYRIKLRFDGYPAIYDFWINADSMNIFPAGWCSKTGRELEVSRRLANNRTMSFEWKEYLRQTNTQAAHRACFPNVNTARTQMNPFKIGMKLEADDIKNSTRICVATIGDVIDSRILVTLDGFDSCFNYWTDIRSPNIHPINYHRDEEGCSIIVPPNWRMKPFSWDSYLRMNRAEPVPRDAFHTREPKGFVEGMALEVVDKKNPSLIRPAIIIDVQDYHIKILFIGWPEKYAYWIEDDSCDIFPPDYCKKSGHPIECPLDDFIYELPKNSCGMMGCRGIGNGKRPDVCTHSTLEECPYEDKNWSAVNSRPNRVDRKHKAINRGFNVGAGPSRKVSVNPAFEKVQVSLQKTLNPAELASMSSKDVEIFRRLQVSANFLLENRKTLSDLHDKWIDRLQPLRPVQVLAAAKNPLNWSKEQVASFVSQLPNCASIGPKFIEHDIDGVGFLSLRQSDMVDIMELSMGAAIKVFNRIMLLREECNTQYIRYI